VIAEHFTDTGVVKVGLYDKGAALSKVFGPSTFYLLPFFSSSHSALAEIPCSAWPRFQHLNFNLGVVACALHTTFAREYRLTTPDPSSSSASASSDGGISPPSASSPPSFPIHIGYLLRAEDAVWTSRFRNGTKVDLLGTLTMHFMFKDLGTGAAGLRIESLEFESRGHEEWVARGAMEVVLNTMAGEGLASEGSALSGALGGFKGEEGAASGGKEKERPKSKKGAAKESRGMVTRRRSASQKSTVDLSLEDDSDDEEEAAAAKAEQLPNGERKQSLQQIRSVRVPSTPVGPFGVTEMGMRCLEVRFLLFSSCFPPH
jgi:hypothetical protein